LKQLLTHKEGVSKLMGGRIQTEDFLRLFLVPGCIRAAEVRGSLKCWRWILVAAVVSVTDSITRFPLESNTATEMLA
jgi:hypothetical protein